jgi:hypothetical protein
VPTIFDWFKNNAGVWKIVLAAAALFEVVEAAKIWFSVPN